MLDKTKTSEIIPTQSLNKKLKKQKGATMIEYALVVAAIVGIAVIAFNSTDGTVYTAIDGKLDEIATEINDN
jgi:Flp/Fap pilin component.